ncbi:DUF11 domain-containing protein, partial [Microbacterium resistens]|uniref:DUF7507 domain-containing protein n=1 Tax=Microbacterium resistens TaxID=156977 RepID=UPI001C570711
MAARTRPTGRTRLTGSRAGGSGRRASRFTALLLSAFVAVAGLVGLSTAPAHAVTNTTCGFATPGTGKYAQALCWFNFAGYNASEATSAAGQEIVVMLPGGSRMTFTLKASGGGVSSSAIPTWGGAYLGNVDYRGIPGRPAMYQTTGGTTTDLTLSNIRMFNPQGVEMQSFSLVGADAESTDGNESIRWTSSHPIYSLTAQGSDPGIGNACPGGLTGVGTTQVTCSAGGHNTSPQTGGPILASENPDFWTQRMVGGGRQAVAFGVLISQVELRKQVESRFAGDDFQVTIDDESGAWHFEDGTGPTGTTASTGLQEVVDSGGDPVFRFRERMNSGLMTNYDASWSCTRNGERDATLPSGRQPGYSADVHVGIGDVVVCTLTNTRKPTGVSLAKKAGAPEDVNGNGLADAGDRIAYTFEVTNTGELPLNPVTVDDPKIGSVTCPAGELAPDETVTCTADAPYTITAEDQDNGAVVNTATATGTPVGTTDPQTSRESRTRTPVTTPAPALELTKSASPHDAASYVVGQEITYTFVVTNTGNVPVDDVSISEDSFSGSGEMSDITCPDDRTLNRDESMTCTATYTLTQADVDAGRLDNTASASGTPAGDTQTVSSNTAEESIPGDPRPAVDMEKSVSPETVAAAGDTVTYTFRVTNTGNVTVQDPQIQEQSFSGTGGPLEISCPSGPLAPGATAECTATYVVTQADVDAGVIDNTATASATPPPGQTTPVSDESSAAVMIPADPSLTLDKSADTGSYAEVGQVVTYRFDVTNTGNVTLSDVTVDDVDFTGSGSLSAIDCPQTSLAGGEAMTCTATYEVTQEDIDNGAIDNAATASGTPVGSDEPVDTPRSNVSVPADRAASLSLEKTVDPTEAAIGDTVTYTFSVTNTGNVSVSDIEIEETAFTGAGKLGAVQCPDGVLAPGASTTCTATYTLVPEDGGGETIDNTAVATATPPTGMTEHPRSAEASATVDLLAPAIALTKSADRREAALGETITYTFSVTNTGEVPLTDIVVTETEFTGSGEISEIVCDEGAASLAPGETSTCTATYVVTQADVDQGQIENTAEAAGTPPNNVDPIRSDDAEVTIALAQEPGVALVKSADKDELVLGETITYSFVVENTGNVTLHDVTVNEGDFTGSGDLSDVTCGDGAASLSPGATVTCTATYVVTQADVDRGSIENTATATGTPPAGGDPVTSDPSDAQVPSSPQPGITVVKTADKTELVVGDTITYSFTVENTGNLTLSDITVNDGDFTGTGDLSAIDCPADTRSFAPGDTVTCTATYMVTQADVDRGSIENTATATGTPPTGDPLTSDPSDARVPAQQEPGITVVKTADKTELVAGDTITYSFTVENTGNVTLSDITVNEGDFTGTGDLSDITCEDGAASLAPGDTVTCTATYMVTQADVDRGSIENTATATATPPTGDPITSDPSRAQVPQEAHPELTLVKSADRDRVTEEGERITYSFLVTNTGNVTLSGIIVEEAEFSGHGEKPAITCPAGAPSLAPRESRTCTATDD